MTGHGEMASIEDELATTKRNVAEDKTLLNAPFVELASFEEELFKLQKIRNGLEMFMAIHGNITTLCNNVEDELLFLWVMSILIIGPREIL